MSWGTRHQTRSTLGGVPPAHAQQVHGAVQSLVTQCSGKARIGYIREHSTAQHVLGYVLGYVLGCVLGSVLGCSTLELQLTVHRASCV